MVMVQTHSVTFSLTQWDFGRCERLWFLLAELAGESACPTLGTSKWRRRFRLPAVFSFSVFIAIGGPQAHGHSVEDDPRLTSNGTDSLTVAAR